MRHVEARLGSLRQRVRAAGSPLPRGEGRGRGAAAPLLDVDESQVPPYALEALRILSEAGRKAFVVGGFVRDCLRGEPAHDVDVATDAMWYQTRDIFMARGCRVVDSGARHGTVTAFVSGRPVEVTTFRSDGAYSDHRRPDSVRFVRDVEDDLARRDFTVNAMAWSPETGVVDPFGGRADLAAGLVRAVGDPAARFGEDALRIMRAVRFSSQLGFAVEEATSEAVHALSRDLAYVARERVGAEYDGIVSGRGAVGALRAYPDVAAAAVPPILAMVGFDQRSRWHCYDVWEHCLHALDALEPGSGRVLRHVTLLHDVGKPSTFSAGPDGCGHFYGHEEQGARILRPVLLGLGWRKADVDRACCLVRMHDRRIVPSERGVLRALARISSAFPGASEDAPGVFADLLRLKRADAAAHDPSCVGKRLHEIDRVDEAFRAVSSSGAAYRVQDLAVDGNDAIACGVEPGPQVGRALRRLLDAVIDAELPNERGALLEALKRA